MQSQFKFKRPKKERINAQDYARGFLSSFSSATDPKSKAATAAQEMAQAARNRITADDKADKDEARLSMNEIKDLRNTANFWDNIAGHVQKVKFN